MTVLLPLCLGVLAAGVLLELLLARILSPAAKGALAAGSAAAAFAAALAFLPTLQARPEPALVTLAWAGSAAVYAVDGLSALFALMATGIGAAILLYSVRYMGHEAAGHTRFYVLMLGFIGGMVHLVCSASLLFAYASWEVIGLCSYFLVGFWYTDPAATAGARKVLLMTHLPGYGLLAAVLTLQLRTGSVLWTRPEMAQAFSVGVFLLMLLAAMAKSVLVPLHSWIPEAMHAPTPVSALLHSACYVKAGVYLLARLYAMTSWAPGWNTTLLALGGLTMLIGAAFALAQTDLKRLLAFSTISQLGHILTALGLGGALGVTAGLFYCVSHGLFKATLFLCAGAVQQATGTRELRRMGGLAARMPWTAAVWLVASAAIVGIPLTNGFVAKWLLYTAALEAGQIAALAAAWIASTLTAVYMLKATVSVFYGELPARLRARPGCDPPATTMLAMGLLALACLVFGVAPQLLADAVVLPAAASLGFPAGPPVTWLGLGAGAAGVVGVAAAGLLTAALLAGFAITTLGRSPRSAVNVFTGGDPLPVEGVVAADFSEVAELALAPLYRVADPDPVYRAAWRKIDAGALAAGRALRVLEHRPCLAALALGALVLAAAWLG